MTHLTLSDGTPVRVCIAEGTVYAESERGGWWPLPDGAQRDEALGLAETLEAIGEPPADDAPLPSDDDMPGELQERVMAEVLSGEWRRERTRRVLRTAFAATRVA